MKKTKSRALFLIMAVLFLGTMSYVFSACSSDEDEKENIISDLHPFVGYWQYLDEEGEYHSILSITESGNYQLRYQDGESMGANGGTLSFDKKTDTLIFSPTFNNGIDTKDSDYQYIVYDISNTRLQVVDDDGNSITYEKISDGTFTQHSDWGKSLVGGRWIIEVESSQGEFLYAREYTFFEGGIYTYWDWGSTPPYYYDGTFKFDKKSITFDGEQADIITLTSNSLIFTMDNNIYSGKRIDQKDKQLVNSNKKLLIGTWLCVNNDSYYYEQSESRLILKPNGVYENEYDDGAVYKGTYYVSENKIFFDERTLGGNPIFGEYQIRELNTNKFVFGSYPDYIITGTKSN